MDDEKVSKFIAQIGEQMVTLEGELVRIRASVNVLKVILASELNRNDPSKALKLFRQLEERILNADPQAQAHQKASEILEVVNLWKKHGQHEA